MAAVERLATEEEGRWEEGEEEEEGVVRVVEGVSGGMERGWVKFGDWEVAVGKKIV